MPLDSPGAILADADRLAALDRAGLVDTPPEEAFDRLTRVAAVALAAPMAFVTLVTGEREFTKSWAGITPPSPHGWSVPLAHSLCPAVVASNAPVVLSDARLHPDFASHPVVAERGVVAYVGVPLRSADGHALGALCAVGREPRSWSEREVRLLEDLAAAATGEIVRRAAAAERQRAVEALMESEARFRSLIENGHDPITIMDAGGIIRYGSPAYGRVFGYTPEELLGRSGFERIHPADVARVRVTFAALIAQPERSRSAEFRYRHRDGRWLTVLAAGRNLLSDPAVAGVVINTRDVTQQVSAEGALRDALQMLATVIGDAPLAVVTVDREQRVTSWNPAAERLFGWTAAEVTGRPLPIVPEERRDEFARLHERKLAGLGDSHFITQRRRKDGTLVDVELATAPLRGGNGAIVGGMAFIDDVSRRVRLEEQLRQAQKMEVVGQLAAGVAHDFNNIATIIDLHTTFLLEAQSSDDARADLNEIRKATARAAGLTRQLLAFSRKQLLDPELVSVNDIVTGMRGMLERLLGADIRIELSLAEGAGRVLADRGQLEQVLLNLAVNARDAMPRGGRLAVSTSARNVERFTRVGSDLAPGGRYVCLSVSDSGTGMPRTVRERIFEPFFTTKAPGRGTGMGLATVHGIVRQSSGFIEVQSTPGAGTTFTIWLPAADGMTPSKADGPESSREGPSTGSGVVERSQPPAATILVAEDDLSVRDVARRVLARAGHTVLEAANGREALAVAAGHAGPIHLLLTDAVMPELGGGELAHALRSARPGLEVLYMSGYNDDEIIRRGVLECGAPLLQKPFTASALATRVREVLGRHAEP